MLRGFIFQREREIDDGIAEVARRLPVIARRARIGSEEGEVHALELLRADALDEIHLLAHRLQLAERLVVIQQADIDGRKITFAQNFGNLFALERRRAHDRHAIKVRAAQIGLRARRTFESGVFGRWSSWSVRCLPIRRRCRRSLAAEDPLQAPQHAGSHVQNRDGEKRRAAKRYQIEATTIAQSERSGEKAGANENQYP